MEILERGCGALTSGSAASGWSTGSEVARRSKQKGSGAGRREVEGRSAGGVGLSAGRGRRARGHERAEGEWAFAGPREQVLGRGAGLRGERGKEELGWVAWVDEVGREREREQAGLGWLLGCLVGLGPVGVFYFPFSILFPISNQTNTI